MKQFVFRAPTRNPKSPARSTSHPDSIVKSPTMSGDQGLPIAYKLYRTGQLAASDHLSQDLVSLYTQTEILQPSIYGSIPPEKLAKKIDTALRNSLLCIGAFVQENDLKTYLSDKQVSLRDDSQAQQKEHTWKKLIQDHPLTSYLPRKPRLVGFVRAVGDSTLVATLHDIAVLPELQRNGIGSGLLRRITWQLYDRGIVDVGLMAPLSVEGFFEHCSFGDDTEDSVPMILTSEGKDMLNLGTHEVNLRIEY